jgi:hypothetical protein
MDQTGSLYQGQCINSTSLASGLKLHLAVVGRGGAAVDAGGLERIAGGVNHSWQ